MHVATRSTEQEREVHDLAEEIFRESRGYLSAIARRNAHSEADAQEALSEAFAAFQRAYDPHGGAPPLAWLTLTLKRECWSKRRAQHLDRLVGQESQSEVPGSSMEAIPSRAAEVEDLIAIQDDARRRLALLKPDERAALTLLAIGYSYAEIGEIKGWTYTKVNRCICEGRAALRRGSIAD